MLHSSIDFPLPLAWTTQEELYLKDFFYIKHFPQERYVVYFMSVWLHSLWDFFVKQEHAEIEHLFSSSQCNDLTLTLTLLFVHCRSSDNHTSLVSKMVEHMLDPSRYNKKIRPGADKGQSHYIIRIIKL